MKMQCCRVVLAGASLDLSPVYAVESVTKQQVYPEGS